MTVDFPNKHFLINGEWVCSNTEIDLINPSTGDVIAQVSEANDEHVNDAVGVAKDTLENTWKNITARERSTLLSTLGRLIEENYDVLASLEATDVGKPLRQAQADVKALARYMEFYAGAADKLHGDTIPYLEDYTVYTLREPHGVCAHIIPWNYPMQIIGRSVGAALATGNTCILKPAEEACLTALAFGALTKKAGFPDGVLNIVTGSGKTGASLSQHSDIDHISFTGSVSTGIKIQQSAALATGNTCILKPAEEACLTALAFGALTKKAGFPDGVLNIVTGSGKTGASLSQHSDIDHISFTGSVSTGIKIQQSAAQNVIPVTLELGGKSPQIVFADADLDAALPFLVNAGVQNAGQTCSASSRILVQKEVYPKVVSMMAKQYEMLLVGSAMDDLDVGPLISKKQHEIVSKYIQQGKDLELVATGKYKEEINNGGFYCLPHLFVDVPADHSLAQNEIFGPVQIIMPFDDEDHAVEIANGTGFGLVASVWTQDGSKQMRMAKRLKSGQVFINNYGAGGGVELPFGGRGLSGHGREKGFEAMFGFTTIKTVAHYHG